jgi:hypothetical protein
MGLIAFYNEVQPMRHLAIDERLLPLRRRQIGKPGSSSWGVRYLIRQDAHRLVADYLATPGAGPYPCVLWTFSRYCCFGAGAVRSFCSAICSTDRWKSRKVRIRWSFWRPLQNCVGLRTAPSVHDREGRGHVGVRRRHHGSTFVVERRDTVRDSPAQQLIANLQALPRHIRPILVVAVGRPQGY